MQIISVFFTSYYLDVRGFHLSLLHHYWEKHSLQDSPECSGDSRLVTIPIRVVVRQGGAPGALMNVLK